MSTVITPPPLNDECTALVTTTPPNSRKAPCLSDHCAKEGHGRARSHATHTSPSQAPPRPTLPSLGDAARPSWLLATSWSFCLTCAVAASASSIVLSRTGKCVAREHTRELARGAGVGMGNEGAMGAAGAAPAYIDGRGEGAAAMVCMPVVAVAGDWPLAACMASRRA